MYTGSYFKNSRITEQNKKLTALFYYALKLLILIITKRHVLRDVNCAVTWNFVARDADNAGADADGP